MMNEQANIKNIPYCHIFHGDCLDWLDNERSKKIDLSFIDPPFNQGKEYRHFNDKLSPKEYWGWMLEVLKGVYSITTDGGAIYFMQREKNAEDVLRVLRESGWSFQNLIVWQKKTSAIPSEIRFGKQYQIIVFATKGKRPRIFNKLRIDPPLPADYKYNRTNGMYITDVWSDIRELTSGYFAGDEAIKDETGRRIHIQQSPIALLLRIILSSSNPGDCVFDPFAGSGTTLVVANQLYRKAIGVEIDESNIEVVTNRLKVVRESDDVRKYYNDYVNTEELDRIWPATKLPLSIT